MVSIRRRKLLGLCSGKNSSLAPLPRFSDYGTAPGIPTHNMKPVCVHPMPSIETNQQPAAAAVRDGQQSSDMSGSCASTELQNQQFSGLLLHGGEIKRRKRQQRKHFENQEACLMRGVYFKNMKWQAAIKVDKKQIHLGTVGSQEEAAHLYDRAAFMCGREPNFELSEEEKHELRQFKWDEFLAVTRLTITNKKHRRRVGAGLPKRSESLPQNRPWEGDQGAVGISASEDVKQDTSTPQF